MSDTTKIRFALRIDHDKRRAEFCEVGTRTPIVAVQTLSNASLAEVCREAAAYFLEKAGEYDNNFQFCGKKELDEQIRRMTSGRFIFSAQAQ